MCLHTVMNKWQLTYFRSLKNYHVLIFFQQFLPQYQTWSRVSLSADTYMASREWCPSMPISPCNDREGWRRDGLFSIILLTTIVRWFLLANIVGCQPPSLTTRQSIRVSYFLVTIGIYIYIYMDVFRRVYIYMHILYMCIYVCVHTYLCINICIYICMYKYMYKHRCIYIHIYSYAHVYVYW